MVRLDQVKKLEEKVLRAIELIKRLKEENKTLKAGLNSAQTRIDELEDLVNSFKQEQREIEEGIIRALNSLDKIEDEVHEKSENKDREDHNIHSANKEQLPDMESEYQDEKIKEDAGETTENSQLDIF